MDNLFRNRLLLMVTVAVGCAADPVRLDPVWDQMTLKIGGGVIEVQTPEPLPVDVELMKDWVQRAAEAVSSFYGRYPVKHVLLVVQPNRRGGIGDGVEHDGQRIDIRIGRNTTTADLMDNWMLTHEMFHLSQPDFDDQYQWMSEGMADYLEPVARVRIGQITVERFWKDLVEGLPQGLPDVGDEGLDRTHTWGRTYWGGCLFWLMADVQIRQHTHNRKSVRNAAKAVLDAGGNGSRIWPFDMYLATADDGTGTQVFKNLHDEQGLHPVMVDLPALWKSLGVVYQDGQVSFDAQAPLASVRTGITAPQ